MDEKQDLWGEIESAQTEELPSVMISGQPDLTAAPPQMYGGQQMILLQQPSSAPKVIGIFVIIYGALSAFGGWSGGTMDTRSKEISRMRHPTCSDWIGYRQQ